MALNFIKHTWQKIVLITVAIVVAIVLLLALLVNIYWSPILASKVKIAVTSSSDSLYTVDFADAKLHILQGKIVLYDINFKPDTAVYNRRKKQHRAPDNLVSLHVKRLVLSHIHPFALYFKHILNIDQIIFSAPDVDIRHQPIIDTIPADNRTLWQKLNKTLHLVHVGQILLNDIKFRYDDRSGIKPAVSELKEMNLKGNDLLIDSATQKDTSRLLYCKDIVANLHNYKGKTNDGLYTYTFNSLTLSTYKSQLNIEGLALEPENDFYKKSRKERFRASIDSLQLNHFDFLAYHKYHRLRASNFMINGGNLDIFANPNKPIEHKNKTSSFPNMAIYKIPFDIKIDTLLVNRTKVTYGEFNPKSHKAGAITFNNIHGKFLNVTTNKVALQKNNIATAQITSNFMDRGKLSVFFTFNLTDKSLPYSYKGKVGPMDLQAINPATMPLAMVKVTSGTLKEFTFDIKGDVKRVGGNVALLYNNLKVKLLKADTVNDVLKRKTIESLFANVFIIKHDNPDNVGGVPRSVNVSYVRSAEFPFFKTIWQTLLAGIKPCVGLNARVERATTELMDKKELKKKNRLIKKEMRKERRAGRKLKRQQKR
ncbi:MAG: hypothetical protein ABI367_10395, partial [Mucilaginibacter sp.]